MISSALICLLVAIVCLFSPVITLAELPNGCGVYFDTQATVVCMQDGLNISIPAYIILSNVSDVGGVAGWQGCLTVDDNVYILNFSHIAPGIDVGTPPEYIIGFNTPLPFDDLMVLATFAVYATAPGGVYFEAISSSSWITPVYISGSDGSTWISMQLCYGGFGLPCATLGDIACPEHNGSSVPTTLSSWGAVKSLYK